MTAINQIDIQYHTTPMGELILGSFNHQLCLLDFLHRKNRNAIDKRIKKYSNAAYILQSNTLLEAVKKQIDQYLNGERYAFDVPIIMMGTEFQKSVWRALLKVPFGTTLSYLQLANNIGNKKAVRAVATANGANAMSLLIPCHRIIGKNGYLVGYAGGLAAKKHLLLLEQSLI